MWAAAAVALVALIAAAAPTSAVAHGPCGCLEPRMVPRGEPVRITGGPGRGQAGGAGYPAYRVIFNPRPADLIVAPEYLASAYRADVATTTVLSRPRREPTRKGTFHVPRVPPGLYMVLIFDGGEGGAHSTWDYLHVIDSEQPAQGVVGRTSTDARAQGASDGVRRGEADDGSTTRGLAVTGVVAAVAGLGAGFGLGRLRRQRRRARAPSRWSSP
jgi:hypothetical protein